MAKKDKSDADDSGDGYKFEVPDFDEDAFIHKEMVSFKTTSVLFVWGIVAALVSWGLFEVLGGARSAWFLGLAVVAAFGYLLRFLYARLDIDISHFGRREWLGTGFLLFFTWLAFFMVFLNPPISDHAAPHIEIIASPPVQQAGGDIGLDIWFEDNHRIAEASFVLTHGNGDPVLTLDDFEYVGGGHYRALLTNASATTYTYHIEAFDPKGHNSTVVGEIPVSSIALDVTPKQGDLDAGQNLIVTLRGDAQPLNVYLRKLDDTRIYLRYSPDHAGYIATAAFPGWTDGANTFDVVAEFDNGFYGPDTVPAVAVERGPFTLNLTAPSGAAEPVLPNPATTVPPNVQRTPGPGLVAIGAVALVGAAVARRRSE